MLPIWLVKMAPWVLPVAMMSLNCLSLLTGLLVEGRLKVGAAKFTICYAMTVPSAMRGDLNPFWVVLSAPPS